MNSPLVSIIMPVFNGAEWIKTAVTSIIEQTHEHWELIVIDNASSDHSTELVRQFKDPRIKIEHEPNRGVSAARNKGLDLACGEFVCFIDCDDRLPAKSLSSRLQVFHQADETDFVDGTVVTYNAHFNEEVKRWQPSTSGRVTEALCTLDGSCFAGITWMLRRSAIGQIRFREEMTHSEDLAFFIEVSQSGGAYAASETETYHIRRREGSAMSNLDGLALGYRQLCALIGEVHPAGQAACQKKAKSIMVKSYLKRGQIFKALNEL